MKTISWKTLIIPFKDEKMISRQLIKKGHYGKMSKQMKKSVKRAMKKTLLHFEQVQSLRRNLLRMKIMKKHTSLQKMRNKLEKEYNYNIIHLSKKYDFAPVSLFRAILKEKYSLDKQQLKILLHQPNIHLNPKMLKEFKIAKENDIINGANNKEMLEKSQEYENKIGKFLDKHNIDYKTQEELTEEQKKNIGYAVNTPDFLLTNTVIINGKQVNWIEVKDFYGAYHWNIKKKIQKQINKYITAYGSGALVFSLGCSKKLKFKNTIMLHL